MIDVHCHLNFHHYEKDLEEIVKRAKEKGITKIINVGTSVSASESAVELSQKYDDLYAIVGVHPHDADKLNSNWLTELTNLLKEEKVLAIGEIGMDFFEPRDLKMVNPEIQKKVFISQVELAFKNNLPIQIHNRLAQKEIFNIISFYKTDLPSIPGMFHCFSGNMEFLKNVLDLGFYVGFDGNITYEGIAPGETVELKELVKYAPLDRIVTETDAPFLTPIPYRGSRNEPSYVIITGEFIGSIKGVSFEEVDKQTTENALKLFNLNF